MVGWPAEKAISASEFSVNLGTGQFPLFRVKPLLRLNRKLPSNYMLMKLFDTSQQSGS